MGITLTIRHLLQTKFIPTLRKFHQMSVFEPKTAYRLNKIFKGIDQPYRECWKQFEVIGEKFAKRDENGLPLVHPEDHPRQGQHIIDESQREAYEVELNKLLDTSFKLNVLPIEVDFLTVRLSGEEISALEPIIVGLE